MFSAQAIKCYSCAGAPCGDPFRGTVAGQVDCVMACEKRTVTGFTSKGAEDVSYVKIGGKLTKWAHNPILTSYHKSLEFCI